MTPQEKAKKLVERMIIYHSPDDKDYEAAKDCALIAVDEILAILYDDTQTMWSVELTYWHQVRKEIQAL
jgi:hypothetical protein